MRYHRWVTFMKETVLSRCLNHIAAKQSRTCDSPGSLASNTDALAITPLVRASIIIPVSIPRIKEYYNYSPVYTWWWGEPSVIWYISPSAVIEYCQFYRYRPKHADANWYFKKIIVLTFKLIWKILVLWHTKYFCMCYIFDHVSIKI